MPDNTEARLNKLESRVDSIVNSLNKINQTTSDHVVKLEKNFSTLETRLTSTVASLNKINQATHDHVVKLERDFSKLEKMSSKINKVAEPRTLDRNINKIVEMAMKAYDKGKP